MYVLDPILTKVKSFDLDTKRRGKLTVELATDGCFGNPLLQITGNGCLGYPL